MLNFTANSTPNQTNTKMNSAKKPDLKPRPMDIKGLQKSGAVGIPKVEKRQTTKIVGFSLSSSKKRKPEENEKYEPTPKVIKTTAKQTSAKPLRDSKNIPKPKAELKRPSSVLPNRIQLKDTKDIQSTPKPRVPKVLTEKSLNTMTAFSLKKLILEQQDTIKHLNIQIKDLSDTVSKLKESQNVEVKEPSTSESNQDEQMKDVKEQVVEQQVIEKQVIEEQQVEETKIEDNVAESAESIVEVAPESVDTTSLEEIRDVAQEEIQETINEVVQDVQDERNEDKTQESNDVVDIQETEEVAQDEIHEEVQELEEIKLDDSKRVNAIIQSIIEENEQADSPIQIAPKPTENIEHEEFAEATTVELSKVLNFDECEKDQSEQSTEDEEMKEVSILKKTPVRKRNLRKKRKSVDNLVSEF